MNFPAKPYPRKLRLSQLIREEMSLLLQKEVHDPRVGRLIITDVEINDDYKTATVKVCKALEGAFEEPTPKEQRECLDGLKSAGPFIFERMKRRLPVKRLPWFEFKYNRGIAEASKLWSKMSELREKESQKEEEQ